MTRRTLTALAVASTALVLAASAPAGARRQPPGEIKVQVAEVHVRKKTPKELGFEAFDVPGSTRLRVFFTVPGHALLGLDVAACKLTACQDDKGTDLTRSEVAFAP